MNHKKKEDSDVQTKTGVWPLIKGVTGEGAPQEDNKKDQTGKETDSQEEKSKKQD